MPLSLKLLGRTPVLGLVRGPGRHRPVRRTTPSDRVPIFPTAPPAGVVAYGFRHCLTCSTEIASVVHPKGGHTCGDCGRVHYTDEDGDQ